MSTIDIIIFSAYLIGIVLFGLSFYKKNKTAQAFTVGNQQIPTWVVSLSIFATFVSSISYLGLPGQAFASNWNPFVFSLSIPIASFVAVRFFVPLYRQINSPSAYTYLEQRFGPWAKNYAATMYLLTQLMRAATIMFLLALLASSVVNIPIVALILITGISVMLYSMLGGIQAVIWTDAIQAIILIAGAILCFLIILIDLPGGFMQVLQSGINSQKFSLGSYSFNLTNSSFWCVLIYGIFINLQNYGIDQNYIQRYMTSSNEREAKKSAISGSLLYIPMSLLFLLIGTSLFAFYQQNPQLLPPDLPTDRIFPHFIVNQLPIGVRGFLIASIFAAGMSTVSTSINSSATVILTDFCNMPKTKHQRNKHEMKILYTSSFIFSLLSILIATSMINVKSALDTWWQLASIFSGGMLGLFLLGFMSKKVKAKSAIIGAIVGIIVIAWMSLSPIIFPQLGFEKFMSPFHKNMAIVFGTSAIFITGFFLTIIAKHQKKPTI
ncbi:MAG: sodium:solute symporter [Mangrovibacterium sp.]